MNIIRSTNLCLLLYAFMFVFTFGNYMATPRVCHMQQTNADWSVTHYEEPCRPHIEALLAASLWPIYWPLRLSWEAQS